MKTLVTICALVCMAATAASGAMIWQDDFDGYADQAAFDAVYTQLYPSYPALLDQAKGYSDSQSVHFLQPTVNSQRRAYRNLGGEYGGTDDEPLKIEFMIDLDTLIWSTRQYIEIRGYSGSGYADGTLEDLIAAGCVSSGVTDTSKYAGRVLLYPGGGWFSYATAKSTDWVKLTTLIKTNTVEFYVNDVLDTTKSRAPGYKFDCIVIGSGLSSAGADVWFDDLVVEIVPEPGAMALLVLGSLGGVFLRRQRA